MAAVCNWKSKFNGEVTSTSGFSGNLNTNGNIGYLVLKLKDTLTW
jgi:hypothetical protein